MALQRLKDAAEKAKIELSQASDTQINLPFITADARGRSTSIPAHTREVRRSPRLARALRKPLEPAIKDAGLKIGDLDEIILVGGSTRMPMVQEL